jgi:hypothetical protein
LPGFFLICALRLVFFLLFASFLKVFAKTALLLVVAEAFERMSYASGRFEGTGMLFALAQDVFRQEFYEGFGQESIWRFDARALQLPDTLSQAWNLVHGK